MATVKPSLQQQNKRRGYKPLFLFCLSTTFIISRQNRLDMPNPMASPTNCMNDKPMEYISLGFYFLLPKNNYII